MHECYAMQILEKKKQNQRTMVTKGRAMKHKDQEAKDRLGTQNHTNHLTKSLKLTPIKRFGIYTRHTIFLSTRSLMK